jgi:hypothetical protein
MLDLTLRLLEPIMISPPRGAFVSLNRDEVLRSSFL